MERLTDKSTAAILINYKKPEHTIACLQSLFKYCDDRQFDVMVVDNGSGDNSVEIIKTQFPSLTYIVEEDNLGFAEGNNVALRLSLSKGYRYSLIINNDTIIDEDLVAKLIHHLDYNLQVAAVQPAIYWLHKPRELWNGPGYYSKWLGKAYNKNSDSIRNLKSSVEVEWLTGCCMLVRNDALKQAGLFNSKFFLYYEDVDLSYRLRKYAGRLDYLPTAKLYHEAGVSGKSTTVNNEGFLSPMIHYYVSRNHLWFIRRYGVTILYPVNLLLNVGFYFLLWCYFTVRRRKQKAGYLMRGLKEGLFTPIDQIWLNE